MRPLLVLSLLSIACSETSVSVIPPEPQDLPVEEPDVTEPEPDPDPDPEDPPAQAKLYANTTGELFEVEPQTGWVESVGVFAADGAPVRGMVDIAIDERGRLFGATFDALWRIDAETAELVWLCDVPFAFYALTATSDGVLVGGAEDDLVRIDPDTCATQTLVRSGDYDTSGDIVGLPDGKLYWTVLGGRNEPDRLVRVDPVSGHAQPIGSIGFDKLFGVAFADDKLFGFSANGNIIRMDPNTGRAALLAHTPDLSWWGAATNPVKWE